MGDIRTLKGTIHGKIIELETAPGWPEGQQVTVLLRPAPEEQGQTDAALEALKSAAGSWSDDPDGLDRFLEWNRQARKVPRREIPE